MLDTTAIHESSVGRSLNTMQSPYTILERSYKVLSGDRNKQKESVGQQEQEQNFNKNVRSTMEVARKMTSLPQFIAGNNPAKSNSELRPTTRFTTRESTPSTTPSPVTINTGTTANKGRGSSTSKISSIPSQTKTSRTHNFSRISQVPVPRILRRVPFDALPRRAEKNTLPVSGESVKSSAVRTLTSQTPLKYGSPFYVPATSSLNTSHQQVLFPFSLRHQSPFTQTDLSIIKSPNRPQSSREALKYGSPFDVPVYTGLNISSQQLLPSSLNQKSTFRKSYFSSPNSTDDSHSSHPTLKYGSPFYVPASTSLNIPHQYLSFASELKHKSHSTNNDFSSITILNEPPSSNDAMKYGSYVPASSGININQLPLASTTPLKYRKHTHLSQLPETKNPQELVSSNKKFKYESPFTVPSSYEIDVSQDNLSSHTPVKYKLQFDVPVVSDDSFPHQSQMSHVPLINEYPFDDTIVSETEIPIQSQISHGLPSTELQFNEPIISVINFSNEPLSSPTPLDYGSPFYVSTFDTNIPNKDISFPTLLKYRAPVQVLTASGIQIPHQPLSSHTSLKYGSPVDVSAAFEIGIPHQLKSSPSKLINASHFEAPVFSKLDPQTSLSTTAPLNYRLPFYIATTATKIPHPYQSTPIPLKYGAPATASTPSGLNIPHQIMSSTKLKYGLPIHVTSPSSGHNLQSPGGKRRVVSKIIRRKVEAAHLSEKPNKTIRSYVPSTVHSVSTGSNNVKPLLSIPAPSNTNAVSLSVMDFTSLTPVTTSAPLSTNTATSLHSSLSFTGVYPGDGSRGVGTATPIDAFGDHYEEEAQRSSEVISSWKSPPGGSFIEELKDFLPGEVKIKDIGIVPMTDTRPQGPVIVRKPVDKKFISHSTSVNRKPMQYVIVRDSETETNATSNSQAINSVSDFDVDEYDKINENDDDESAGIISYYDKLKHDIYEILTQIQKSQNPQEKDNFPTSGVSSNENVVTMKYKVYEVEPPPTKIDFSRVISVIRSFRDHTSDMDVPEDTLYNIAKMILSYINHRDGITNELTTGKGFSSGESFFVKEGNKQQIKPYKIPNGKSTHRPQGYNRFGLDESDDYYYVYYDEIGNEYLPQYVDLINKHKLISPSDEFTKAFLSKHTSKLSAMLTNILQETAQEENKKFDPATFFDSNIKHSEEAKLKFVDHRTLPPLTSLFNQNNVEEIKFQPFSPEVLKDTKPPPATSSTHTPSWTRITITASSPASPAATGTTSSAPPTTDKPTSAVTTGDTLGYFSTTVSGALPSDTQKFKRPSRISGMTTTVPIKTEVSFVDKSDEKKEYGNLGAGSKVLPHPGAGNTALETLAGAGAVALMAYGISYALPLAAPLITSRRSDGSPRTSPVSRFMNWLEHRTNGGTKKKRKNGRVPIAGKGETLPDGVAAADYSNINADQASAGDRLNTYEFDTYRADSFHISSPFREDFGDSSSFGEVYNEHSFPFSTSSNINGGSEDQEKDTKLRKTSSLFSSELRLGFDPFDGVFGDDPPNESQNFGKVTYEYDYSNANIYPAVTGDNTEQKTNQQVDQTAKEGFVPKSAGTGYAQVNSPAKRPPVFKRQPERSTNFFTDLIESFRPKPSHATLPKHKPQEPHYHAPQRQPIRGYKLAPSYKPALKPQYQPASKPQYQPSSKPQYQPAKKPHYQPAPKPQYQPAPKPQYQPAPQLQYQDAAKPPAALSDQPPVRDSYQNAPPQPVHQSKSQTVYKPAPKPVPKPQTYQPPVKSQNKKVRSHRPRKPYSPRLRAARPKMDQGAFQFEETPAEEKVDNGPPVYISKEKAVAPKATEVKGSSSAYSRRYSSPRAPPSDIFNQRGSRNNVYIFDERDLITGRHMNDDSTDYIFNTHNNQDSNSKLLARTLAPDYSDFDYVDIRGSSSDVDTQRTHSTVRLQLKVTSAPNTHIVETVHPLQKYKEEYRDQYMAAYSKPFSVPQGSSLGYTDSITSQSEFVPSINPFGIKPQDTHR